MTLFPNTMETVQGILRKFQTLLRFIVTGSDEEVEQAWNNLQELEKVVQELENAHECIGVLRNIRKQLFCGKIPNIKQIPALIKWFDRYLKDVPDSNLIDDLVILLQQNNLYDISVLEFILQIVFYKDVPLSEEFSKEFVNSLAECPYSKDRGENLRYNESANRIQEILKKLVDKGIINLKVCLEQLYLIISNTSRSGRTNSPGIALCIVLLLVEKMDIKNEVEVLLESQYKEAHLLQALIVISEWLVTGKCDEILIEWFKTFIEGLEVRKKCTILMKLTEAAVNSQNAILPFILPSKKKVRSIYIYLLKKQNSCKLFREFLANVRSKKFVQNCSTFPAENLLDFIYSLRGDYTKESVQILVDVIQALMMRFPDDGSYEIMQKSFPIPPREGIVQKILAEPVWKEEHDKKTNMFEIRLPYENNRMNFVPGSLFRDDFSKVGLANLGNTCYMNSVLQALVMTRQFRQEVLNYKTIDLDNQVLLSKLQNLFALLVYSKRNYLSPSEIFHVSRPSYFMPGQQQDSSEFLCYLLDMLHEQKKLAIAAASENNEMIVDLKPTSDETMDVIENDDEPTMKRWTTEEDLTEGSALQRKTHSLADFSHGEELDLAQTQQLSDSHSDSTDSGIQSVGGEEITTSTSTNFVHRIFGGESKITYQCAQCDHSSDNTDKFRELQLCFPEDIPENQEIRVQDLLNFYLAPENLTGDNKYHCDICKKLCDAQRIIKILQAPVHLILTLKHFRYDSQSRLRAKLRHKVAYDETINLPIFNSHPETYRLYAAVVHSGNSMDYGHYFTYACDSKKQWYKFNDSHVSSTTLDNFKKLVPPDTPYILFYERSTSDSNNVQEDEQNLMSLSQHIQDLVQMDTKSLHDEFKFREERNRSSLSWMKHHDNSDDDNDDAPSRTCREPFAMSPSNCLY